MRLLNSSLYNIPALNNKSINNVSFEASATWPATVSRIWNEYIYIWKWGTGKETSISWKFSSKKILRSSRKNFWGKKEISFKRSNHFHRSSLFLFIIFFFILYPVNELSKGGIEYPWTIDNWFVELERRYREYYVHDIYSDIFKREMEYLFYLFGKTTVKSLTHRCTLE